MKLRTKLMLSPVTGAVMLVCVLIAALWCLGQVKERTAANESAMLQGYSSVGSLQGRLGAIHVELYRTMAVINTISDKDVKDRLSARKRESSEIDALASDLAQAYAANERARTALSTFRANLSAYAEASENAITLSTEAVNAQAMQAADRR